MEWMIAAGLLVWWWHRHETRLERRRAVTRHPAARAVARQQPAVEP